MGNIATWLRKRETATGEMIEAIVVALHYDDEYADNDRRPVDQRSVAISRDAGLSLLDAEYDNDFGGANCFPMYAWSASWVYFIGEYDGSTGLSCVPRHPIDCEPHFNGE